VSWDGTAIGAVLGTISFAFTAGYLVRKRIVWLWRPAYFLSRFEVHKEGGLTVSLICQNGGPGTRYVSAFDLLATPDGMPECLWVPQDSESSLLLAPEGASIHHIRLRLVRIGSHSTSGIYADHAETELMAGQRLVSYQTAVTLRIDTSEGAVFMIGDSLNHPVAVEKRTISRAIRRLG